MIPQWLQWGRRNSPAETRCRHEVHLTANGASMGPPEFTGGNAFGYACLRARHEASMGPPEFTGGNACRTGRTSTPRLWCFNGAAGIHRRKPCSVSTTERRRSRLQWGRRNSPAETW